MSNFKIMKVFDCQDMPEDIRRVFFDAHEERNDSYVLWTLETAGINDTDTDKDYDADHKLIDQWLIDNGAKPGEPGRSGETVLINHWW